jgi:hypothetical protein
VAPTPALGQPAPADADTVPIERAAVDPTQDESPADPAPEPEAPSNEPEPAVDADTAPIERSAIDAAPDAQPAEPQPEPEPELTLVEPQHEAESKPALGQPAPAETTANADTAPFERSAVDAVSDPVAEAPPGGADVVRPVGVVRASAAVRPPVPAPDADTDPVERSAIDSTPDPSPPDVEPEPEAESTPALGQPAPKPTEPPAESEDIVKPVGVVRGSASVRPPAPSPSPAADADTDPVDRSAVDSTPDDSAAIPEPKAETPPGAGDVVKPTGAVRASASVRAPVHSPEADTGLVDRPVPAATKVTSAPVRIPAPRATGSAPVRATAPPVVRPTPAPPAAPPSMRPPAARPKRRLTVVALSVVTMLVALAGIAVAIRELPGLTAADANGPTPSPSATATPSASASPTASPSPSRSPKPKLTPLPFRSTKVSVNTAGFWSWSLMDRRTGKIVGSSNYKETSTTASMIKPWLAADYLRMADEAGKTPSESRLHELEIMIRDSDNAAALETFNLNGKTASIERLISMCGLTDSQAVPNEWGTTRVSARDAVRMGDCIADGTAAGAKWTPWVLDMMRKVRGVGDFGPRDVLPPAEAKKIAIKDGWLLRDDDKNWHVNCLAVGDTWVMSIMQRYPSTGKKESEKEAEFAHTRQVCRDVASQLLRDAG